MTNLNERRNSSVNNILIISIDGLNGFEDAIHPVFPNTEIQRCIVNQIRYSTKLISYKDIKAFMKNLRLVYQSIKGEIFGQPYLPILIFLLKCEK